jgi:hypothetical protein
MGDLGVDVTVIVKVEIGCRGAKCIYRFHDRGWWKTF